MPHENKIKKTRWKGGRVEKLAWCGVKKKAYRSRSKWRKAREAGVRGSLVPEFVCFVCLCVSPL